MLRGLAIAIAAMACAVAAEAEEVSVSAVGHAEVEAQRVAVLVMNGSIFSQDGDDAPSLPATVPATTDPNPIADAIRRADATARELPFSPGNPVDIEQFGQLSAYVVMLQARSGLARYEIAAAALPRVEQALRPYRRLVNVSYVPIAPNPGQLREQAARAALANARERAELLASASGLVLGSIVRVQEEQSQIESASASVALSLTGAGPSAPRAVPIRAQTDERLIVVFAASARQ